MNLREAVRHLNPGQSRAKDSDIMMTAQPCVRLTLCIPEPCRNPSFAQCAHIELNVLLGGVLPIEVSQ